MRRGWFKMGLNINNAARLINYSMKFSNIFTAEYDKEFFLERHATLWSGVNKTVSEKLDKQKWVPSLVYNILRR